MAIILVFLSIFGASFSEANSFAKYNRKEWRHWTDHNKNCLDTRAEILKARSQAPVIFIKKGCKIISGIWDDYYFPEKILNSRQVDIDHLVPLKNAHISGGSLWSFEKRAQFANDPENLVVTNKSYNRSKGSKGIDAWLPIDPQFSCRYISDWIKVKNKYHLIHSEKELFSIKAIKPKCSGLGIILLSPNF